MNTNESPFSVVECSNTAMELEHLKAVFCEIGSLAHHSLADRGEVVTLAWLRRIAHQVDHLETAWRKTLPSTLETTPEQRRRRDDSAHAPRRFPHSRLGVA